MNENHEHDWTPLHDAFSGALSNLQVCRVPGCTQIRGTTPEAEALLADEADDDTTWIDA